MWAAWVRGVSGGASARQLAVRIHRSPTSVAKWLRDGNPPAEAVIDIARAYGADPIAGLIAAGSLSVSDLMPYLKTALVHAPQTWLTEEVHRRSTAWERVTAAGETFKPWFQFPEPSRDEAAPRT